MMLPIIQIMVVAHAAYVSSAVLEDVHAGHGLDRTLSTVAIAVGAIRYALILHS